MRALLLALGLLCTVQAHADFLQDLHAKYPQTRDAVVEKAFGNFYAIVNGNEIVYINEDLSILINGDVVELKTNRSFTSSLRERHRPKFDMAELKEADAIRIGNGTRKLFVFSDPDCPFCRQLQVELNKLQNVSVLILPLPLTELHPGAGAVAESIWCAADRAAAWNGYLLRGISPVPKSCETPLQRNAALATRHRVAGTPALVFEDGSVVPGAISSSTIEARLAALTRK